MFLLIVLFLIFILFIILWCRSKRLPLDTCVMINGGVGSGKTSTAVYLAIKSYKRSRRRWLLNKFIWSKLHIHLHWFKYCDEEPLLYSNIPLSRIKYVPLTTELVLREKRFNYKSIVLISESSLIANSMSYKEKYVNDKLTLFIKLIRHELKGSYVRCPNLIIETQSISDNHYAFDRCITQSLFLTSKINIPFFRLVKAREFLLIPNVTNNVDDDLASEKSFRWLIIPKSIFKKYNSYCYSILTDDKIIIDNSMKNKKLVNDFEIPTLLSFEELTKHNELFKEDDINGE